MEDDNVIAYKFLRVDGSAPFTGFAWPVDEWVTAERLESCRTGIHACRPRDLPYWLAPQLWEIDLDGEIREEERKVIAARGRLVRRIDAWTPQLLDDFADDLLRRTRLRFGSLPILSGYIGDIGRFRAQRRIGLAAFAAARAAELYEGPRGYERERARQAAWLAARLGLA